MIFLAGFWGRLSNFLIFIKCLKLVWEHPIWRAISALEVPFCNNWKISDSLPSSLLFEMLPFFLPNIFPFFFADFKPLFIFWTWSFLSILGRDSSIPIRSFPSLPDRQLPIRESPDPWPQLSWSQGQPHSGRSHSYTPLSPPISLQPFCLSARHSSSWTTKYGLRRMPFRCQYFALTLKRMAGLKRLRSPIGSAAF